MKKIYFLILLPGLIASLKANGQPVITAANSNPVVGETFTCLVNQPLIAIPVTNGGAMQTWDISSYPSTQTSPRIYVDPATTPYAALYPAASVAGVYPGGIFDYHLGSSAEFSYLGAADNSSSTVYADFKKRISYPFTYNDSFTDTYNDGSGNYGSLAAAADGYGSMILPYGTINNLLRVYIYSVTVYAAFGIDTLFENSYYWYGPGIHNPVCIYIERTWSFDPTTTFYTLLYLDQNSVGIENLAAGETRLLLFPNPAHNEINIQGMEEFTSASIINLQGQEIKKTDISPATATLYVGDLSRGIYFLKTSGKGNTAYSKFVVE